MFEGFENHRNDCKGVKINCMMCGAGPPVLLLHGFPQNLYMWGKVAPLLAKNYAVVAADLRGYGASDKPQARPDNSNYSFRAMAEDQVILMRQLGFERFHVIGHDRGGRTGHRFWGSNGVNRQIVRPGERMVGTMQQAAQRHAPRRALLPGTVPRRNG